MLQQTGEKLARQKGGSMLGWLRKWFVKAEEPVVLSLVEQKFEQIRPQMANLIRHMAEDVCAYPGTIVIVLKRRLRSTGPEDRKFIYYYDDYPLLDAHFNALELGGFVRYIGVGAEPTYIMTQPLIDILAKRGKLI